MVSSRFARELSTVVRPRSVRQLEAAGVPRSTIRGPGWRRTSHGFYVPAEVRADASPTQRIVEAVPLVPPTGAIGGWGSAFAQGVDQLDGLDSHTMAAMPVLICLGADIGREPRPGIRYSRSAIAPEEMVTIQAASFSFSDRTAFDGARLANNLEEAVAFVDAMAHTGSLNLVSWPSYLDQHSTWIGIAQARQACALADTASRSTWESRLRVVYILDAGLPRPVVNVPVFDHDGKFVGIPDLLDLTAGYVVEFDGQQHRLRAHHRADNVREEAFERLGLTVVRVDSLDLDRHRPATVTRLADGYRRGLRRDRSRDAWTVVEPGWWMARDGYGDVLTDDEKDDLYGRFE